MAYRCNVVSHRTSGDRGWKKKMRVMNTEVQDLRFSHGTGVGNEIELVQVVTNVAIKDKTFNVLWQSDDEGYLSLASEPEIDATADYKELAELIGIAIEDADRYDWSLMENAQIEKVREIAQQAFDDYLKENE
jgi:hypothetical protein